MKAINPSEISIYIHDHLLQTHQQFQLYTQSTDS